MYFVLILLLADLCYGDWTPSTFPNPRTNGYRACGMRSISNVCDPDHQLSEGDRYRLNNDLLRLARSTSQSSGDYCGKRGLEAVLVIVKHGNRQLAEGLNKLWDIDGQCQKAATFLLSTSDHKVYFAGEQQTGISQEEFDKIVSEEQHLLNDGQFMQAMEAILKKLGAKKDEQTKTDIPTTTEQPMRKSSDHVSVSHLFMAIFGAIFVAILLK